MFRLCTRRRRLGRDVHGLGMLLGGGGGGVCSLAGRAERAGPAHTRLGPDACAQKNEKPFNPNTELTKKPVDGFSAGLVEDSLFEWAITVMGPPDTY